MAQFKEDWICSYSECKNLNFAHRKQCNRCGRERDTTIPEHFSSSSGDPHSSSSKRKTGIEIGKFAAEKSKGLFSAEDWQCSKCANVNWARRHTCNLCNAPRFCDNEKRTGFAGGYNDRGIVEYKKREDYDDEYDEFGRKKKRLHNSGSDKNSSAKNMYNQDKGASEELEDDEDDDDADTSKYDLWNLSDEDDNKNQPLQHTAIDQCVSSKNKSSSCLRGRKQINTDYCSRGFLHGNRKTRSRSRSPISYASFRR